jgi:hypothetical protein
LSVLLLLLLVLPACGPDDDDSAVSDDDDDSVGSDDDDSAVAGDDDDSAVAGDDDDSSASGDDDDSAVDSFACGTSQCLIEVEYCETFVGGAPPQRGQPPPEPSYSCQSVPASCLPPPAALSTCLCVLTALGMNGVATCNDTVPGQLRITLIAP